LAVLPSSSGSSASCGSRTGTAGLGARDIDGKETSKGCLGNEVLRSRPLPNQPGRLAATVRRNHKRGSEQERLASPLEFRDMRAVHRPRRALGTRQGQVMANRQGRVMANRRERVMANHREQVMVNRRGRALGNHSGRVLDHCPHLRLCLLNPSPRISTTLHARPALEIDRAQDSESARFLGLATANVLVLGLETPAGDPCPQNGRGEDSLVEGQTVTSGKVQDGGSVPSLGRLRWESEAGSGVFWRVRETMQRGRRESRQSTRRI
jgi:hypothetical protein